jgi:hypothetical protein
LPWVARLSRSQAPAVAAILRLRADVTAALLDDDLWLRGATCDEALDRALQYLAPAARYVLSGDDDSELIRLGDLLPQRRLPETTWLPLTQLFEIDRPRAALPGRPPLRVAISVIPSDRERPATMLLASWADWSAYARSAPLARLRRLRFAATGTGTSALIAGVPLPPVHGVRMWEDGGIALPCGWEITPAVDPPTLRRAMGLNAEELALFREDGSWELVPAGAFVPARRSAVRRTGERGAVS